jgi:hypothetical protein
VFFILVKTVYLPPPLAGVLDPTLSRNKDVFAWSALNLVEVSRTIIEHGLGIDPSVRSKKQRLRKMSDEKTEAAKAEVHRLLEANFI